MRFLLGLTLVSSLAISTAGVAAPPIAFAKTQGGSNEVWLVNPDGTGAKRIYSASSKVGLAHLDVRPGGGQLAIVENRTSIRLINYDAAGNPTGTVQVPVPTGCNIYGMDYHPTGGSLLFSMSCAGGTDLRIERYADGQLTDVIAGLSHTPRELRWTRDGSAFLWRTNSSAQELRRSDVTNPSASTVLWATPYSPSIGWFDMARTSDAFLLTWSGPPAEVHRYVFDFAGVTNQGVVASGQNGHYSPDDSGLLYRVQTKSGYNLTVRDAQGTRTIASGSIGVTDWQP